MNCEKFESAMIDELYDEPDEPSSAAAKRHIAECARCSSRVRGLRATRSVASMSLLEPSQDLEQRILAAMNRAQIASPSRPRMAQMISLAGSWAMRPQTAMAAVFLVMIGTSVLLLRGKSARAPVSAEVTVTEQGTPAPVEATPTSAATPAEIDRLRLLGPASLQEANKEAKQPPPPNAQRDTSGPAVAASPAARPRAFAESTTPAQLADQKPDEAFDAALRSYRAGRFNEAARAFDALGTTDPNAPDLWAARAIRDGKGCRAAVTRFDKTAQRYKQTPPGWDALLEGALCYRALGDFGVARTRLNALLSIDSHKDRARVELDRLDELQQAQASGEPPVPAKAMTRSRASGVAAGGAAGPPAAPPPPSEPADSSR